MPFVELDDDAGLADGRAARGRLRLRRQARDPPEAGRADPRARSRRARPKSSARARSSTRQAAAASSRVNGTMIDPPLVAAARRVLSRAR